MSRVRGWYATAADLVVGRLPDDVVQHDHTPGCACGPATVPIVTGQGERIVLLEHKPLVGDG